MAHFLLKNNVTSNGTETSLNVKKSWTKTFQPERGLKLQALKPVKDLLKLKTFWPFLSHSLEIIPLLNVLPVVAVLIDVAHLRHSPSD